MAIKSADQITVVDITDGYTVNLSMDAISLNGGTSGLPSTQTVNVIVTAKRGTVDITPTVTKTECVCTPNTVTVGTISTSGYNVTVPITLPSGLNTNGTVVIPVKITEGSETITITKTFSFSVALTGATGGTGLTGVSMRNKGAWASGTAYTAGTTGGTYIDVVTESGSSYACKASHTASSSNKPPNSTYWTLLSEKGEQGIQGIQGIQGVQGNAGADAISMVITTNNGNIFRNNSGNTTLTAHVYKAGAEVTGSDLSALGTIKWYKDGGSTAVATGASLTVQATDVASKAVYEARLEG